MPTCTAGCPTLPSDINKYTQAYKGFGNPTEIFASQGYVGFAVLHVNLGGTIRDQMLRLESCSLKESQEITNPSVIDGRIDNTVYQLGPKIVEGDLSMPLIADLDSSLVDPLSGCPQVSDLTSSTAASLLDTIWCISLVRNSAGRLMYDDSALDVRYANSAAFRFDRAMVNRLSLSITQSGPAKVTLGMICRTRNPQTNPPVEQAPIIYPMLSPARVLTWNDFSIDGYRGCDGGGGTTPLFYSNQVREFSLEVTNDIERYFTLNGDLYPTDIAAKKRSVTGTLKLMGWNHDLSTLAENNQYRFTEKNRIRIAAYIGNSTYDPVSGSFGIRSGTPIFDHSLSAVVFKIEEMSLTNDLLESTIAYTAMASDQTSYEFSDGLSCSFPPWI